PRLHGPYWQWTRKIAAKTICRWLSDDQHRDYQPWIDNDRRLHALLTRLEALGTAAFEADPRWQQRGRTSPAAPADQADVGTARLTCGQPSSQPPFPQVIPKREDLTTTREEYIGPFACGNGRQGGVRHSIDDACSVQDPHNDPQLAGDGGSCITAAARESM